jgi:methylation protein EvaC
MISEESRQGLHQLETYYNFGRHAKQMASDLSNVIRTMKNEGNKVIGYGAAAKGNTLLNYAEIDLEYIVDDNPMKCGLLTPGRNISIENTERLFQEAGPIAILVLAWNFFDEIRKRVIEHRGAANDWWIEYFPAVKVSRTR